MKEQKACKERKEIKRTGGKRDKEISGMEKKKAEKEDKICLNDALGRKEKSVKNKKDIGKMQ